MANKKKLKKGSTFFVKSEGQKVGSKFTITETGMTEAQAERAAKKTRKNTGKRACKKKIGKGEKSFAIAVGPKRKKPS